MRFTLVPGAMTEIKRRAKALVDAGEGAIDSYWLLEAVIEELADRGILERCIKRDGPDEYKSFAFLPDDESKKYLFIRYDAGFDDPVIIEINSAIVSLDLSLLIGPREWLTGRIAIEEADDD